ncbi:uncharacterized protein LOC120888063 [Ictidomys tridecemlineatus]
MLLERARGSETERRGPAPSSPTYTSDAGSCSRWSHGRMQASVKDKPLDTGPIYFFDQLKPERNKWEKETYEKELSQLMLLSTINRPSGEENLPVVIHLSLPSKFCLENGWIFKHPYSKLEILKWMTVLSTAVERLQEATTQM